MKTPSPHVTVLALDISPNSTGWALGSCEWQGPKFGRWQPGGSWEEKHRGTRLAEWREFLATKIKLHGVGYLALERFVIPKESFSYDSHVPMAQQHGQAILAAHDAGIRCGQVSDSTWRAHFLGTGKAPKQDFRAPKQTGRDWLKQAAIKRCVERNWYTDNDDTAEALGILDYALFCLDPDYAHKHGPAQRRKEHAVDMARFRGEALL